MSLSLYDFRRALELRNADEPFYALIAAAMLRADTGNAATLAAAFPDAHAALAERYHAPGGLLSGEPGRAELDASREAIGMPPAGPPSSLHEYRQRAAPPAASEIRPGMREANGEWLYSAAWL